MAAAGTDSRSFEEAVKRFRADFLDQLPLHQRLGFSFINLDQLKVSLRDIQDVQAKTGKLRNMRRLKAILEGMESLDRVIQVFLNATEYVGFVWGPMKFLLETASNFEHAFDSLLDTYSRIGRYLPLIQRYENLFTHSPFLQDAVVAVYETILIFHAKALRRLRGRQWKVFFCAAWKTFQTEFGPHMKSLEDNVSIIEKHAALEHCEQFQAQALELQKLQIEQARQLRQQITLESRQIASEHSRRREFLNQWLLADGQVDQDQHLHEQKRQYDSTSGQWLLKKPQLERWLDSSTELRALLWMTGPPGTGKTVLTSVVVEALEKRHGGQAGVAILRFYCKGNDPSRDNFVAVARSLLWQILRKNEALVDWLYEEASKSGQATLASDEKLCQSLLRTALASSGLVYAVIDGVDECHVSEQSTQQTNEPKKLIRFLRSLVYDLSDSEATQYTLRCLLVSQNDKYCSPLLTKTPMLSIEQEDTASDIRSYIASYRMRVRDKFHLSDREICDIEALVHRYARGMFLYAELVMRNLLAQHDQQSLYDEVKNHFPKGIHEAYDRILHRMLLCDDLQQTSKVRDVLGLIAVAQRPLKWREIKGVFAIDPDSRQVDYVRRGLVSTVKDLCSSLVDERANGDIEFVHNTARMHLLQGDTIDLQEQHMQLGDKCMALLSGEAFDAAAAPGFKDDLATFVMAGSYSFAVYAVALWSSHVETTLYRASDSADLDLLSETLEAFLEHNFVGCTTSTPIEIAIKRLPWSRLCLPDAERAMRAVSASKCQRKALGAESANNEILNLSHKLQNILKALESLSLSSLPDLQEFYGVQVFKCPRMSCKFFAEGFKTANDRDDHVANHERPYRCTYRTCNKSSFGFATQQELREHLIGMHNDKSFGEADFLSKKGSDLLQEEDEAEELHGEIDVKGRQRFKCEICPPGSRQFTRQLNLTDHVNSFHKGQKPHQCSFCEQLFARNGDRNRHEKDKHHGSTKFKCQGSIGGNDHAWGCGQLFSRGYKLSKHYTAEKDDGTEACIDPLVKLARYDFGRYRYRCRGEVTVSSAEHAEPEQAIWGCSDSSSTGLFKTEKALKKHWKSAKGRTECLKLVLEGPRSASSQQDSPTQSMRAPYTEATQHNDNLSDNERSPGLESLEQTQSWVFQNDSLFEQAWNDGWAPKEPGVDFDLPASPFDDNFSFDRGALESYATQEAATVPTQTWHTTHAAETRPQPDSWQASRGRKRPWEA